MQAYSLDLRERVVADREAGLHPQAAEAKYRPKTKGKSERTEQINDFGDWEP